MTLGRLGGGRGASDDPPTAGQWRAPRDARRAGPATLDRRPPGRVVRVERLPRPHAAPRGGRGRARRARPVGHRLRRGAARSSGSRPVHHELEAALAEWKGTEAARAVPTGFAANLGVLTTFAGPDVARVLRRAQPRVDHRRPPPGAARRSRSTATATPRTSTSCCAPTRGRARSSSPTPCSRWTATSRRSTSCSTCAAHHGALLVLDEAHARARARPSTARRRRRPCCASARCRRRWARSAASSPGRVASPTCS